MHFSEIIMFPIKVFFVFIFVNFSWLIFRSETLKDVFTFVLSLSNINVPFKILTPFIFSLIAFGLFMQVPTNNFREKLFRLYIHIPLIFKTLIFTSFIVAIYLISMSSMPPFIYFAF